MNRNRSWSRYWSWLALVVASGCGSPPPGAGPDGGAASDGGPALGPDADLAAPDGGPMPEGSCLEVPERSFSEPFGPHDRWAPCADGRACEWMDVRIHHEIGGVTEPGIALRLIRPTATAGPLPLYAIFPGTGTCLTRPDAPDAYAMELASRGVLVAGLSLRGHRDCYPEGDPLHRASTWIGPAEMADYDRLLWAFVRGEVRDDLPPVDPARVGFGGGSHGAITSVVYARHACLPSLTGHPFALVVPSAGAAAVSEWLDPGLDPDEELPSSAGAPRLTGLPPQAAAYAGPYWDTMREAVRLGVPSEALYAEIDYRSVYDADGGLDSFLEHVASGLFVTGTHDCIVPRGGIFELYRRLRDAGAGDRFRLYTQVAHHSCKAPDPDGMSLPPSPEDEGYYPRWTDEAMRDVMQTRDAIRLAWIEAQLLSRGDVSDMPEFVYMLAGETDEPGETPALYAAAPPGEAPVRTVTWHLDGSSLRAAPSAGGSRWTLSHDPGDCTEIDVVDPCTPPVAGSGALLFVSEPLTEPLLVVGAPQVRVAAQELTGRPYTLIATLAEVPDPARPTRIWPVTSGRRHDATPTGGPESIRVEMDDLVHRVEPGHAVALILSSSALPVHRDPMFAPSTTPFELSLSPGAEGAVLELPVAESGPTEAPSGRWRGTP